MKPKKLILSAWGPYAGCQQVDFDGITDGLFLLTGPTGSGKTMIFDGISYALFGALSGKVRERDTMRSDFAGAAQETYVTLVFEHKGREYTITRAPKYTRKKKRGDGEVTVNEKACLYMPDGTAVENPTAVNERITDILGVGHEQFKQIAMIAQGEFQELLIADSKKRVEIFRNIFGTEADERIGYILTERAKALYSQISTLKSRTDEAMASIISDGHEDLACLLAQTEKNDVQIYEVLHRAVSEDKKALAQADQELSALETVYSAIASDDKLWREHTAAKERECQAAKLLKKEILKNEGRLLELKEAFDALPQKEEGLRRMNQRLDEFVRLLELFKEAQAQQTAVKQALLKAASDEAAHRRQKSALEASKQTFDKNKTALLNYAKVSEDVVRTQALMAENRVKTQDCETLIDRCRNFVAVKKKHAAQTPVYEAKQHAADELKQRYEAAELRRQQAAAGILAKTLLEGSPCPVCGALHHPLPAKEVTGVLDGAALKKLKKDSETAAKDASDMLNVLTGLHKEKYVYWQDISRQAVKVLDISADQPLVAADGVFVSEKFFYEAVQAKKTALSETATALKAQLEKLQQEKACLDGLSSRQQKLEAEISSLEASCEAASGKYEASRLAAEKQQTLLENMVSRIPKNVTHKTASEEKTALEAEIEKQNVYIQKVRSDYSAAGLQLAKDKGQLQKSEEVIRKHEEAAAEVLKRLIKNTDGVSAGKWLELRRTELEDKKAARDRLYHRYHQNMGVCGVLKNKGSQKEKLSKDYGVVKSLENAARGNNPRRLEFEQYVLGAYFDEILAAANVRLEHMSEGRYELFRSEKVKDMRKRSSLDIEVLDNYTGRRRSVKTLSGGETFKAALSLALGLSDVIQSYVGGIDIDLLFIDEGFGSLDETSVQTAVDTLMALADGSRMVGIISHVAELKERIDAQIIIEKGVCGSIIKRGGR